MAPARSASTATSCAELGRDGTRPLPPVFTHEPTSYLGRLIGVHAEHADIEASPYRSWTLKSGRTAGASRSTLLRGDSYERVIRSLWLPGSTWTSRAPSSTAARCTSPNVISARRCETRPEIRYRHGGEASRWRATQTSREGRRDPGSRCARTRQLRASRP